jgi:hypothetical protein
MPGGATIEAVHLLQRQRRFHHERCGSEVGRMLGKVANLSAAMLKDQPSVFGG